MQLDQEINSKSKGWSLDIEFNDAFSLTTENYMYLQVKLAKLGSTVVGKKKKKKRVIFCHCSLQLGQRCPILSLQPSMNKSSHTVCFQTTVGAGVAPAWLEWISKYINASRTILGSTHSYKEHMAHFQKKSRRKGKVT